MGGTFLKDRFKELNPGWEEREQWDETAILSPSRHYAFFDKLPDIFDTPFELLKRLVKSDSEKKYTNPLQIRWIETYKDMVANNFNVKYIKVKIDKLKKDKTYNYKNNDKDFAFSWYILTNIQKVFNSGFSLYFPNCGIVGYAISGQSVIVFTPICMIEDDEDIIMVGEDAQMSFDEVEDELW